MAEVTAEGWIRYEFGCLGTGATRIVYRANAGYAFSASAIPGVSRVVKAIGSSFYEFTASAKDNSIHILSPIGRTDYIFTAYNLLNASRYCTAEIIYDIFGKPNVRKWAKMNTTDNNSEIDKRIDRMIVFATADINDKLRGGPYDIPFDASAVPSSVELVCAMKAGLMLYEHRGADDMDYEGGKLVHRYSFIADRVNNMMEEVRRDARRFTEDKSTRVGSSAPGLP